MGSRVPAAEVTAHLAYRAPSPVRRAAFGAARQIAWPSITVMTWAFTAGGVFVQWHLKTTIFVTARDLGRSKPGCLDDGVTDRTSLARRWVSSVVAGTVEAMLGPLMPGAE